MTPALQNSLEHQARELAAHLPKQSTQILMEDLEVPLFGGTKAFDHLDFSAWFNGFFPPDTDVQHILSEAFAPLYSTTASTHKKAALQQWITDLTTMAQFIMQLREQCIALTGMPGLQAEHVHLKSWQVREYKAQWWHLDRGEISAIATIAGHTTTEFLLGDDPAPYPERPIGYDVFVFPEQLSQTVHHCPIDEMLICGARARKERGLSYLWHRAPESHVERIVLVLKTLRHT